VSASLIAPVWSGTAPVADLPDDIGATLAAAPAGIGALGRRFERVNHTSNRRDRGLTFCTVPAMSVHVPTTVDEAVAVLASDPAATILAGGTDLMVEVNEGLRRPGGSLVATHRIAELRSWRHDPAASTLRIGAGVTYRELMAPELAARCPALAEASRTVGSPQIRNAGTLGGNLGTCSPAGDGLPVLAALDATVELASTTGRRTIPVTEFMVGVKRTALAPGELIVAVTVPVVDGYQAYAKVGVRNAMVIAVATACVVVDAEGRRAAIALGSVGPTILRCAEAEALVEATIDWPTRRLPPSVMAEVTDAVRDTSRPITDHRSTAAYRRHAVGVLVRRLLARAADGEVAA
jgi:CO/xanthine dehydrogenase FAD-binding subunit